jgi:hypothetical protein
MLDFLYRLLRPSVDNELKQNNQSPLLKDDNRDSCALRVAQ